MIRRNSPLMLSNFRMKIISVCYRAALSRKETRFTTIFLSCSISYLMLPFSIYTRMYQINRNIGIITQHQSQLLNNNIEAAAIDIKNRLEFFLFAIILHVAVCSSEREGTWHENCCEYKRKEREIASRQ